VVIVAAPLRSVAAAAKAAPNTPIVIANGDDPVTAGLVKNLARPGGMITGLTNFTVNVMEKHLELLLAAAPSVRRVGFLADPNNANRALVREAVRRSAAQYSVEVRFSEVANPEGVEPAISNLAKEGAQALVVMPGSTLIVERQRIVKFALAQRWPTVAGPRSWAEAGIMLSYGAQIGVNFKRAAYYVDRILKGAKPADMPIEQPTRFELVVNMKTAKTLGIKIPNSIMVQATKVIE
jgi:putative ABC transport system substrate-binding protein